MAKPKRTNNSRQEPVRPVSVNPADQRDEAREQLERLLLEGLNSGPAEAVTPQWWAERRAKLASRLAEKAKRPKTLE